jgi:hypothetical protein
MLTTFDLHTQIQHAIWYPKKNTRSFSEIFNDTIEYQLRNSISSIYYQELNWEGHSILSPFNSPFLRWNEDSLKTIKDSKNTILNWFINLIEEKVNNDGYTLCQQTYDEDICEVYFPVEVEYFKNYAFEFDWVELVPEEDHVSYWEDDEDEELYSYWNSGLKKYWLKTYDIWLRKGDNLDLFEKNDGSEYFSLRKTFLTDPRK